MKVVNSLSSPRAVFVFIASHTHYYMRFVYFLTTIIITMMLMIVWGQLIQQLLGLVR
jgi:hypothetical protein